MSAASVAKEDSPCSISRIGSQPIFYGRQVSELKIGHSVQSRETGNLYNCDDAAGLLFSVWNNAPSRIVNGVNLGGDYNLDGGGGVVGGGFYDRPNAPTTPVETSFSNSDYISGLFNPGIFGRPAFGTPGNLVIYTSEARDIRALMRQWCGASISGMKAG